jgi:hypothetical protein
MLVRIWQSCKRVIRHTSWRVNAIRHVGQVALETGRRSSPSHSIPSAKLSLAITFVSGIKRSWLHESGDSHLDSLRFWLVTFLTYGCIIAVSIATYYVIERGGISLGRRVIQNLPANATRSNSALAE